MINNSNNNNYYHCWHKVISYSSFVPALLLLTKIIENINLLVKHVNMMAVGSWHIFLPTTRQTAMNVQ